jgi:predicted amidophosphoribosyltransferase
MRGWWQEITGLVLPADCAGCGLPRAQLCARCRGLLGGPASARRVHPATEPPGLPAVYAAGRYGDEVRAVLLAHKERGALGLARPLGTALAGAVSALGVPGRVLLVPVPSARRAVARRGHDATARMARAAAAVLRAQGTAARAAAVLRHRRLVADQSRLDAAGRLANLAGAVETVGGAAGLLAAAPVVLVDDLMTTGTSLSVAASAVRAAGGSVAGAAVVAGRDTR